jgi:hypothetical protein
LLFLEVLQDHPDRILITSQGNATRLFIAGGFGLIDAQRLKNTCPNSSYESDSQAGTKLITQVIKSS